MARPSTHHAGKSDIGKRVTAFALALALGLVLARCMMMESMNDTQPMPGQEIVLRAPGPMVTTLLDLLSFVPAILVAGRALLDERFKLRWPMSVGLSALLAVWAMVSITWSADRFAAGVSAGKLLGGAAIAWAVVQCVRDWKSFRIVCAVVCGLLSVLLVHSLVYRFYELPDTQKAFAENRVQWLTQQGIEPGTFQARQFEQKLTAGELMGFYSSANSLAAVTAMISVIVAASLWQRRRDGGSVAWYLPGIVLLAGAGWIIWGTHSNTAMVTPFFGLMLLFAGWRMGGWMKLRRAKVFAGGLLLIPARLGGGDRAWALSWQSHPAKSDLPMAILGRVDAVAEGSPVAGDGMGEFCQLLSAVPTADCSGGNSRSA